MLMNCKEKKELDDGNCGVVRLRGKEAYVKDRSLRTEIGYKADCAGELALPRNSVTTLASVAPAEHTAKPTVQCRR